MFGFSRVKKIKELDEAIDEIRLNASNNYKDEAQSALREFEARFTKLLGEGKMKDKQKDYYQEILDKYKDDLKLFTHKDQKTSKW